MDIETLKFWNSSEAQDVIAAISYVADDISVDLLDLMLQLQSGRAVEMEFIRIWRDALREWLEGRGKYITHHFASEAGNTNSDGYTTPQGRFYPNYDEALVATVKTEIENDRNNT